MSFRDSIRAISPPWFLEAVADGIQYAEGMGLDVLDTWLRLGVRSRFPGDVNNDSMGYISHDRLIDRGPTETDSHFAGRLRAAFDTWIGAGNPYTIIPLIQALFSPNALPNIRLVNTFYDAANNPFATVWFESVLGAAITKSSVAVNWIWENLTPKRWWRGWVIIEQSGLTGILWTQDLWNVGTGTWGDGFMWGAAGIVSPYWNGGITPDQSAFLVRTVRRWKPQNVAAMILITLSPEVFDVDGTLGTPVNPNGNMNDPATRLLFNAIYSSEIV